MLVGDGAATSDGCDVLILMKLAIVPLIGKTFVTFRTNLLIFSGVTSHLG